MQYLSQSEKNVVSLKQPSEQQAYESIGLQMFKSSTSLSPAAEKVASLRKFLKESTANMPGDAPQFIVFCFYFSNFFRSEFTYVVNVSSALPPRAIPQNCHRCSNEGSKSTLARQERILLSIEPYHAF